MGRNFFLIVVIIIMIIPGCFDGRNDGSQMKYVYSKPSIEVKKDTSALIHFDILGTELTDLYQHIDSIRFISLETSDEALIGRISQLFIVNNKIFIADYSKTKSIFIYNMQGDFLYKIHKFGQGPGEYNNINMVHINDSSITINDWISWKIIQYDLQGKLIFEERVEPHPSDFIEMNNRKMLFYYATYEENTPYQLVFTDSELQWKETAFPHLNTRNKIASAGVSYFQKKRDGKILFHRPLNDTIYEIDLEERIETKFHLGFHAPGEISEFWDKTKFFDSKKMNESMMKIIWTYEFFDLDDLYFIQYPKDNKMFISMIQKDDNKVTRSLSSENSKKPFSYFPFLICGYHQNSMLGYFDSNFFNL